MSEDQEALARQACSTCRRQKRKCTRELPACQLCRKNRRPCEYPADTPSSLIEYPVSPPVRHEAVTLFFLDSYLFSQRGTTVRPLPSAIPAEFYEEIENPSQVHQVVEMYFGSVHKYFPMISKIRLVQLLSSNPGPRLDLTALLLTLKLLCMPSDSDDTPSAATALYDKAKRCLALAEANGAISVRLLQATILMATYEIGNALYPAAYLSIGHSARLALGMGFQDRKNAPQMFPIPGSWTEAEELRRVYWSIHVLDRYVNIGMESRYFSFVDAKPEDLLPMDEEQWEAGEQSVTPSLAVSATATVSAPPFARTCQASHILSRVLRHIGEQSTTNPAMFYEEGMQLHGVVDSFAKVLLHEQQRGDNSTAHFASLCTAAGLCYSAMIVLYGYHTCAEGDDPLGVGQPEQLRMQEIALASLKDVGVSVVAFATRVSGLIAAEGGMLLSTPFMADCLYATAKNYLWYMRETGKTEVMALVEVLTEALKQLGQRWAVANEYLSILEGEGPRPT